MLDNGTPHLVRLSAMKKATLSPEKTRVRSDDKAKLLAEMQAFFRKVRLPYSGQKGYRDYHSGKFSELPPCPAHFPYQPHRFFSADGWVSYGESLGLPEMRRKSPTIWPFDMARRFARSLGLKGTEDWRAYRAGLLQQKRPLGLPSNPQASYTGKGWKGYPDFLGYDEPWMRVDNKMSFKDARAFARGLQLETFDQFLDYCEGRLTRAAGRRLPARPDTLPKWPQHAYKEQWKGPGDFLGFEPVKARRSTTV
jgi:hypothetical protein